MVPAENDPTSGGPANDFYDQPELVAAYLNHRHSPVASPNLVMEDPAFTAAVGKLSGHRILDLGCGDGWFAKTCVAQKCETYLGIDGSEIMISRAEAVGHSSQVEFQCEQLESYEPAVSTFDLVTSRMALHYLSDLEPVVSRVGHSLRHQGRFVFSVVHPFLTAANDAPEGLRTTQEVDDYFSAGPRHRNWFGAPVTWQHRTVEDYVDVMLAAGFRIDKIGECRPIPKLFAGNEAEYQRRLRVPVFLLIAGTKLAA